MTTTNNLALDNLSTYPALQGSNMFVTMKTLTNLYLTLTRVTTPVVEQETTFRVINLKTHNFKLLCKHNALSISSEPIPHPPSSQGPACSPSRSQRSELRPSSRTSTICSSVRRERETLICDYVSRSFLLCVGGLVHGKKASRDVGF